MDKKHFANKLGKNAPENSNLSNSYQRQTFLEYDFIRTSYVLYGKFLVDRYV